VLRLRNKLLPLVRSAACSDGRPSSDPENGFIVVTQVGSQTFGIVVDGVFHTEEIVVKPMASKLRHIGMFSGNTILGDGSVIMIIDPNGVSQAVGVGAPTRAEDGARPSARTRGQDRVAAGVPRRLAEPKACRCRSSRGWKRSIAARSSSPTAATWCSTAAS
jgi:two-component system chemotaxis sensor kinase CheA